MLYSYVGNTKYEYVIQTNAFIKFRAKMCNNHEISLPAFMWRLLPSVVVATMQFINLQLQKLSGKSFRCLRLLLHVRVHAFVFLETQTGCERVKNFKGTEMFLVLG